MDTCTSTPRVDATLAAFGVQPSFRDGWGNDQPLPVSTAGRLSALFEDRTPPAPAIVVAPGEYHSELAGVLTTEDGVVLDVDGSVHQTGYHVLRNLNGDRRLVIVAPKRFTQPRRQWGMAVQLYAARTSQSWGIGDFRDLAFIARAAADMGADSILISPINANAPSNRQQNSPYSPTSREWYNVLHVAPDVVPGADQVDMSDLAARGRALNGDRRIDRDTVWTLKRAALERIWSAVRDDLPTEFLDFEASGAESLNLFATFCALVDAFGPNWQDWPARLHRPGSPGVTTFAEQHRDRVRFHAWCQWVADVQFAEACSAGADIIVDLPVGFDVGGADAWIWQDLLVFDFEVGCPPDPHNTEGQKWGLPPFDPQALVSADFAPFRAMVRAGLRHAAALRMDHVMQLWRLFWVPPEGAGAGAYLTYPAEALLAVLRIEAARAGAWLCGENLGTCQPQVTETMDAIGMLGYRCSMRSNPSENPNASMAAVQTHDQATIVGLLSGADMADMVRIGKGHDPNHIMKARAGLLFGAGLPEDSPSTEAVFASVVRATYQRLAFSPSRVALVTLDDAALVAERPNMPGTINEYPCWRIALPVTVEELFDSRMMRTLSAVMAGGTGR